MIVGFALLIAASGASAQQAGPPAKPVLKAEATPPAKELNAVPQAQPEDSKAITAKVITKRKARSQASKRAYAQRQAELQARAQAFAVQQQIERQQNLMMAKKTREVQQRFSQKQEDRRKADDSEFLRKLRRRSEGFTP
jgi:galactokinase